MTQKICLYYEFSTFSSNLKEARKGAEFFRFFFEKKRSVCMSKEARNATSSGFWEHCSFLNLEMAGIYVMCVHDCKIFSKYARCKFSAKKIKSKYKKTPKIQTMALAELNISISRRTPVHGYKSASLRLSSRSVR